MKTILSLIISGALVVSGFGQTRNVLVGTNNSVVQPTNFWSADASNARTGLGLGTAATNPASAFQPSSGMLSNLASSNAVNLTNLRATNIVGVIPASNIPSTTLTNIPATNIVGTVALASNISGTLAISNGGTGATNAAIARTNLGATTIGNALFTATNSAAAIDAIGISTNFSDQELSVETLVVPQATGLSSATANGIQFRRIYPSSNGLVALSGTDDQGQTTFRISTGTMSGTTAEVALFNANQITFYKPLVFNNTTNAATTRTNLSLGWAALTNTSASGFGEALYGSNTNPVLVNTNGEVVSPTNFWQVAPIVTRFVEFQPSTNATTNIVAARNLHIHSLALAITGVTSTIALPTNNVFNGDIALVVHEGPTSSVTQVRTQGSTNNLVTMNRTEEAVEFVYYNNVWQFNHNQAFVEPIYFSGTNASANAAASRTNLGLGATNDVTFNNITIADQTLTLSHGPEDDVFVRNESGGLEFGAGSIPYVRVEPNTASFEFFVPASFSTTTNAAITRTNLGLGLPALTNTNAATSLYSGVATGILGYTPEITASSTNLTGNNIVAYTNTNTLVVPANILIAGDSVPALRSQKNVELSGTVTIRTPLSSPTTIYANNAITATDDSSYTNVVVSFSSNSVGFSNVTASGTLTATSTVTAKTNLVVEGHLDFTTNATNSNPATNNQIQDFIEIRVGTNQYWLPVYK